MKTKRIVLGLLAAVMAFAAVGVASAQPATEQRGDGEGGRGFRRHRPIINTVRHIVSTVSEATGLEPADIATQLGEGMTLAEIITGSGGSAEDVKATLLADASERLATAVENERITQERADEMLAAADTRIDEMLNRVFERLEGREFPGGRRERQAENEI